VAIGAQRDAVQAPCIEPGGRRLPWRQDGVGTPASAAMRSVEPSTAVSGSHRQLGRWPKRARRHAGPSRFVRRSRPVGAGWRGGTRHDLYDRRPARRWHHASRALATQPAAQRGAKVETDTGEFAGRCVRPVALLADPGVPVAGGRGRWVGRDGTAERVDPRRLIEVAVDDQAAAAHRTAGAAAGIEAAASSIARSRAVVT
jgi:hypothetical protein